MKKVRKVVVLALCAVLLVAGSVMGTLAYLTSTTGTVTNTFTAGNVTITLDEAKVDEYGKVDGESRVTANSYKLIPGHTYVKDPTIHVGANSENCFLFIKVVNGISDIEATENTITKQLAAAGWTLAEGETNVYYYKDICGKGMNIPTFTQFTVKSDVTDLSGYNNGKTVTIQAYAVQADSFGSATAAWAAAPAKWAN